MAARDPDGRIGTVLDGRYRVLEPLSRGGMGVVYRAERLPVGRPVAVKFLHALFADDSESRARFERETRALSKLAHPHCVSIIDFGFDGAPYLVMDLVAGDTLRELLDEGPLATDEAIALTRQLLAGLAHAHAEGIVHRDVKPANVMVTDEIGTGRHVRILDFGLARMREHGATAITQASIVVGTPSYMAPEQTMGGPVDARTDLYAVGVLLFEMLTGQRPFQAEDTATLLDLHRRMPPPRLADVEPTRDWPRGLDAVLQRALAKEPDDRWQSAVEMSAALDAVARGEGDERAGGGRAARGGGVRLAAALAFLVLAGGAAAAAYLALRSREPAEPSPARPEAARPGALAGAAADAAGSPDAAIAPSAGPAAAVTSDAPPDAGAIGRAVADAPEVAAGDPAEADAGGAAGPADGAAGPADGAAGGASAALEAVGDPAIDEDDIQLEPADPEIEPGDAATAADDDEGEAGGVGVTPAPPPAPPPAVTRPPPRTAAQAMALARAGHRDEAIAGLRALWKRQPKNANLPYLLGNLYHEQRWWSVALEHYQAAIKRAPAYRKNATLIRNVIAMLGSSLTRAKASYFLRTTIGAPARKHLEHAARHHKSPVVRKHAAAVRKRM